MKIITVSNSSELKKFIKIVWKIYKNDVNWVPPILADRIKLLDKQKLEEENSK